MRFGRSKQITLAVAFALGAAGAAAAREVPAWAQPGEVERARAAADLVIVIAVDHVGIPRPVRGSCLVRGRIAAIERGRGEPSPMVERGGRVRLGETIEAHIPCATRAGRSRSAREIDMNAIDAARRARLWYFSSDGALIDFQPL